ncbi:MAG TPA: PQQ-like beta-propeller repeat protein [Anaerohalosphaeraceae bacterium]|nr:PQQ-like beta-propeller repeat protein [Anaerohalosphaeraceae bacterium]
MNNQDESKYLLPQNPRYQAAVSSLIVSAAFLTITGLLLAVQFYHLKVTDNRRSQKLEALRHVYQAVEGDESLAEEIRQLDVRYRRDHLARLQFLYRGSGLFVLFGAVFVGTILWVRSFYQKPPHPEPLEDRTAAQIQAARRARWAVSAGAAVLASAALFWSFQVSQTPQEFAGAEEPSESRPTFASWEQMKKNWPVFRGPQGAGICPFDKIPTEWDGVSGKNIRWKVPVDLPGHNSPIVWENRIFLTGADAKRQEVYCFNAEDGTLLWTGQVPLAPADQREEMTIMKDTGYAASTAAVNGVFVAAIFADGQAACFDFDGQRQWVRSLGVPSSAYGYASSLTVYENRLIIQFDQDYEPGRSKLIALDIATGQTLWERERPVPNSWTSPTVVDWNGQMQILTSGSPWLIAYDAAEGRELWRLDCLGGDVAPTQIAAAGRIFAVYPYTHLAAVRPPQAASEQAQAELLWKAEGSIPDICSPVSDGRLVWTLDSEGVLECFDVQDGSRLYSQDL